MGLRGSGRGKRCGWVGRIGAAPHALDVTATYLRAGEQTQAFAFADQLASRGRGGDCAA